MDKLRQELRKVSKHLESKESGTKKDKNVCLTPLDETVLRDMLFSIRDLISSLITASEEASASNTILLAKVATLEDRSRKTEDMADHNHQRSLKGKFII